MQIDYSLHYSNWHNDTREHADVMGAHMWAQFEHLAPHDLDEPILDIGCGYGFLLHAFREAGYKNLQGIEISQKQADVAVKHGHKVEVTSNTTSWLRNHPNSFGIIFLIDVLEHVEKDGQIELLNAVRGALKPGGVLVVQVPNANSIVSSRWRYIDWTHETSFTETSLGFVLRCSGFNGITIGASKGTERLPKRIWRRSVRVALRKFIVRWIWLQIYKAELPHEKLDNISFDLNLLAVARTEQTS